LESYKVNNPGFSTLAQKGDDEVCWEYLRPKANDQFIEIIESAWR
jgi:hypothetical protein